MTRIVRLSIPNSCTGCRYSARRVAYQVMADSSQGYDLVVNDRNTEQLHPDNEPAGRRLHGSEELTRHATLATFPDTEQAVVASPLGNSHASGNQVVVAIGIDRYAAWPHLGNAVNDARATSELFRSLGFTEATVLINDAATGAAMRKLVTDDLSTLGVDDSLVVFFAGHGGAKTHALQHDTKVKTGYIIPVDAENKQGHVATWIRLDTWLDDIARLPPNHILVILDACHSGIALDSLVKYRDVSCSQRDPTDELSRRRSRRVIVSALDNELALDGGPVPGHSLFTGCLIQALTEGLRRDGQRAVSGAELGLHIQKRVREYPYSRQTPHVGAFELDDHGELMIPLFPSLVSRTPPPPRVNADANAALRHKLAMTMAGLYPDRAAIAELVAAHAPTVGANELPAGTAATIWMYVLVELANRGLFSVISTIIEAARSRSRRAKRADWSSFNPLARPPDAPVVASWSDLALELRRRDTETDAVDSALITDGDVFLEAVTTLHWGGVRPSDPSIEVRSSQFFGTTVPLLHRTTLLPSQGPGTASWLMKIHVPRARIRTRKVTVRCPGTDLVEQRYVVPRAGSIFAAFVWFAFAVFAYQRLSPIIPALTVPLGVLGLLSGLWNFVGVPLLRMSHSKRLFRSLSVAWELAVIVAAIAAILVFAVPPHLIVLVTNTMETPVLLKKGEPVLPGTHVTWASARAWKPAPPFCRCDDTSEPHSECQKCVLALPVNGVEQVVLGCEHGDCDHVTETVSHGGVITATIVRPAGTTVSPIVFDIGATSPQMTLLTDGKKADGKKVEVKVFKQTAGAPMTLEILPDAKGYSIEFGGHGTLHCDTRATRIVRFAVAPPVTRAAPIEITIDGTHSTWTATSDATEARACAAKDVGGAPKLTLTVDAGTVVCEGAPVERIAALAVKPRATKLWVKIGAIESSWSSTTPAAIGLACVGLHGDVELGPLKPSDQVTLPKDLTVSRVRVRSDQADPASGALVECRSGDTVRAVKLDVATSQADLDMVRVARLDATTGVTCHGPTSQRMNHRVCKPGDAVLQCWTEYVGECRLRHNKLEDGGKTDACSSPAENAAKRAARNPQQLHCTEIYQCAW